MRYFMGRILTAVAERGTRVPRCPQTRDCHPPLNSTCPNREAHPLAELTLYVPRPSL